ncbi:acyl-CoA dehydrogenase family protein [Sporichthya polymorpha]|uniref:acyl-CoA dehydrogenase family protein n=1 Tax=Sporichthya polymorpha TaxID=35751 RepID=UPI0003651EF2|nr:acyl-CoA dehydrogenase family protein [Sporichthya polymorpha]
MTLDQFEARVREFLDARRPRRAPVATEWGSGEERLALFHETTDSQERAEAEVALAWQRERWAAGFGWITGPVEHGGAGLSAEYDRRYREIEAEYDVPDMAPLRIGLGTVSHALLAAGTPEQIATHAVPLHRGEAVACQLFSEPEAGSDLAGVRTRGVREGDTWRVDGQKVWTSNATFADLGLALIRTDPDAPKHRGLTMFLVPMDAPGIEVRPLRQMTGGASFCEVFLSDVRLDDALRLGEPGSGWKVATSALAGERRAVGDRSHEMNARAMALLATLAQRTGRADDPAVRDAWVALHSRLQIARFQQQRMQATDERTLTGAERAIDKVLLAANYKLIGDLAAELLGPAFVADTGEWGTFTWNRWLMGSMGYRIAGGTEEILKTMLAERVLGLPREPQEAKR